MSSVVMDTGMSVEIQEKFCVLTELYYSSLESAIRLGDVSMHLRFWRQIFSQMVTLLMPIRVLLK
jgi:hypothetical protein